MRPAHAINAEAQARALAAAAEAAARIQRRRRGVPARYRELAAGYVRTAGGRTKDRGCVTGRSTKGR